MLMFFLAILPDLLDIRVAFTVSPLVLYVAIANNTFAFTALGNAGDVRAIITERIIATTTMHSTIMSRTGGITPSTDVYVLHIVCVSLSLP